MKFAYIAITSILGTDAKIARDARTSAGSRK